MRQLLRVVPLLLMAAAPLAAQDFDGFPERSVSLVVGRSVMLTEPEGIRRVSISDKAVAEAVVVSAREVLLNARKPGIATLVLWSNAGRRRLFQLEVMPDVDQVHRQMQALFPRERIQVTASGSSLVLSGEVMDTTVPGRAVALAKTSGFQVVDNLVRLGARQQVLLKVRIAEVSRSAVQQLGAQHQVRVRTRENPPPEGGSTLSDGLVHLLLGAQPVQLESVISALTARGLFRSLAEPNLLALDGEEASFLSGGEFPFPVLQGSGESNAITLMWKEFGVQLRFRPEITDTGTIRLQVAPSVSSLDFANGLRLSGFQIPVVRTRRAETEVELREGQYLSIAGLLDHSLRSNEGGIPILSRIPLIGWLFGSWDRRREDTELVVIISPHLVRPTTAPPPLPAGLPEPARRPPAQRDGGAGPAGTSNQQP